MDTPSNTDDSQDKKARLLGALDRGMVMAHVDGRRPGVVLPPHLKSQAHVRLNLSYRFDPPDLCVDEWGVKASLTFGGVRFGVAVPWGSVFAIASHSTKDFWLFPDDMPPELIEESQVTQKASIPPVTLPPKRPALRSVQLETEEAGKAEDVVTAEAADVEPPAEAPKRSHLRLVK